MYRLSSSGVKGDHIVRDEDDLEAGEGELLEVLEEEGEHRD